MRVAEFPRVLYFTFRDAFVNAFVSERRMSEDFLSLPFWKSRIHMLFNHFGNFKKSVFNYVVKVYLITG